MNNEKNAEEVIQTPDKSFNANPQNAPQFRSNMNFCPPPYPYMNMPPNMIPYGAPPGFPPPYAVPYNQPVSMPPHGNVYPMPPNHNPNHPAYNPNMFPPGSMYLPNPNFNHPPYVPPVPNPQMFQRPQPFVYPPMNSNFEYMKNNATAKPTNDWSNSAARNMPNNLPQNELVKQNNVLFESKANNLDKNNQSGSESRSKVVKNPVHLAISDKSRSQDGESRHRRFPSPRKRSRSRERSRRSRSRSRSRNRRYRSRSRDRYSRRSRSRSRRSRSPYRRRSRSRLRDRSWSRQSERSLPGRYRDRPRSPEGKFRDKTSYGSKSVEDDRQRLIEKWRMNNCESQDEMQKRLQEISQMNPDEILEEENKVWIRSAPADRYYERDES